MHLFGVVHELENTQSQQADIFVEAESDVPQINTGYLLLQSEPFNKLVAAVTQIWLTLAVVELPALALKSACDGEPEQSLLNSYQHIVSYQYYISSLSSFS